MTRDFGQGIFDMDFIKTFDKIRDLQAAKQLALDRVEKSTANPKNKLQASKMVQSSRNMIQLMTGMSNSSLSHQGLKTIC